MKKFSTLIALALVSSFAVAQISVTAADMPQVGNSQYYTANDSTGVTPGASGQGATWNYATLTPSGTNFTITYGLPNSHPQGSGFPSSTMVEAATNQQYRFMTANTDSVVLDGEKSISNTRMVYDIKPTLYVFPMTFGYTHSDSVHAVYPDGFISNVDRIGEYTVEFDGEGSLTTPFATYPNVFRIKTVGVFFDSSYTGAAKVNAVTVRYEWYSVGTTTPRMIINLTSVSINGGAPQLGKDVWYADNGIGIDNSLSNFKLTVAPSLVEDRTSVSYTLDGSSTVNISVMNMLGEVVSSVVSENESAGVHSHEFDLSGLAPGMYTVSLEAEGGRQVKKIVVQ